MEINGSQMEVSGILGQMWEMVTCGHASVRSSSDASVRRYFPIVFRMEVAGMKKIIILFLFKSKLT